MTRTAILSISIAPIPSVRIVSDLLDSFSAHSSCAVRHKSVREVNAQDIARADTVLSIRPFEDGSFKILRAAKRSGRKTVIFLDDDLLHLPEMSYRSNLRRFISESTVERNKAYLRKTLAECDVLWGCNTHLLEKYRRFLRGGRCAYTDVTAPLNTMKPVEKRNPQKNRPFCLFFAGGSDHAVFLNRYIVPALNALYTDKQQIRLICMGIDRKQLSECAFETKCIPWCSNFREYREKAMSVHCDIGIAALPEGDFFRCKYFNKFVEYSTLGIPGIYTDDLPYRSIVRHLHNGLLAENTVDGWTAQIRYAMEHRDLCPQLAENAQQDCLIRLSTEHQVEQMAKELPELWRYHCKSDRPVRYKPGHFVNHLRDAAIILLEKYENARSES